MEEGGQVKLQLLVDVDLGSETSPAEIVDAFGEAVQQMVYTYGNRGPRSTSATPRAYGATSEARL